MAKVAFLSLIFPPDSVSTAQIMGELAVELKKLGHELIVLTTTPHYNRDVEAESKQPLYPYWGKLLRKSTFNGISVYHIIMPKKSKYLGARFIPFLYFHIFSCIAGMVVFKKPDVMIVPSPPITLGVCAWILSQFQRAKFIYNVQEIYPDCAINLGAIRNRLIIRLLYKLEAFVYSRAAAVTVIAPNMAQCLSEKGIPSHKIRVIPNFVDINDMCPLPRDNEFSRQYNVHNKFVVSYAGNIGPAQDMETFIKCAHILKNRQDIHFMMIGDGMLRDRLKEKAERLKLHNVAFIPYQPYSLVPQIYAASDLCLVPQLSEITSSAIPSKVYRIMACGRPVLAATKSQSDLAQLVANARCGFVVKSGSAESYAEAIIKAFKRQDLLCSMRKAGRDYVVENYTREAISKLYHDLIISLTNSTKANRVHVQ